MVKKMFVPVAALAVTVTGASAFTGSDIFSKIDISDSEKSALEEAQTIREEANTEAKQVLEDAGITDDRMKEIHEAMREVRDTEHGAVEAAIEANDYTAFLAAIADTPFADEIDSEDEFAKIVEAYALKEDGDVDGAKAIIDELGIKIPGIGFGMGDKGLGMGDGGPRGGDHDGDREASADSDN